MKLKKYGLKLLKGGVILRYSVDTPALRGRSKKNQMQAIARIWGLDIPWIKARTWKVFKSRNLRFFPNTYTLEIVCPERIPMNYQPTNPAIKSGIRVMVPRTNGPKTPGTVVERWGDKVKVKLDQLGRRGQEIGKIVWADELEVIS